MGNCDECFRLTSKSQASVLCRLIDMFSEILSKCVTLSSQSRSETNLAFVFHHFSYVAYNDLALGPF
jgi:hypothetical protein